MQLNYHLAAECVHFKGCGKIIAKWSLLLRVWFGTTSNVTKLDRTHQGLFVVFQNVHTRGFLSFFRPYTPGVICRFLGRTHQGLFFVFQAVHTRGYSSVFRPYTPGVILPFLGRTHQGLFVRFCPQTQQGLNVRFCIQTQQGLTVRFSRLYINSQTNCTYHINKSINLFHFHQNHPFLHPKSHRNS